MNFNSLVLQIQQYGNKPDINFSLAIPFFIEMGQNRIWRDFSSVEFEQVVLTENFLQNNAYLKKPAGWDKTVSFYYGTTNSFSTNFKLLKPRTFEICRAYWPNSSNIDPNNPPEFYSDTYNDGFGNSGNFFFISPTPDQAYYYQLTYLKRTVPIDEDNDTNLLTKNYPDLLFYACFLEALAYLRDDERIHIYEANYQRALESARAKTESRHMDRTSNRDVD